MLIEGKCHCGNMALVLTWEPAATELVLGIRCNLMAAP